MYFTNDDYCSLKKMSIFIKVGDKEYFLETGVTSQAFGIQVSFLNFAYGLTIQKGY